MPARKPRLSPPEPATFLRGREPPPRRDRRVRAHGCPQVALLADLSLDRYHRRQRPSGWHGDPRRPHDPHPRRRPASRRLSHARRIRAALGLLDAVAGASRQLAARRQACAAGVRRGGGRHRRQRAGLGRRVGRAVRERAATAAAGRSRGRAVEQRRVDARRRSHLRRQRPRRRARGGLDFQRLGRPRWRALFSVGSRRCRRAEGARDRGPRPLPRAVRARGRRDPRGRAGHARHHRGVPAQPQPQSRSFPRGHRAPAAPVSRRRRDRVAGSRRPRGRDRRPRGQPLRLREAGRAGAHLDQRPQRSAVRDLARRLRAADAGARRAGPALRGAQAPPAGAFAAHRRGGGRRGRGHGLEAPRGRRAARRVVRQLLPRHEARGRAAARSATRPRRARPARGAVPGPRSRGRAGPRDPARAAATCTASRSRSRRAALVAAPPPRRAAAEAGVRHAARGPERPAPDQARVRPRAAQAAGPAARRAVRACASRRPGPSR